MAGKGIEIVGAIEMQAQLERLMKFDPSFEKRLQGVIDLALKAVREGMVSDAASKIPNDPRGAQRAVRRIVYKQILGGQVNILKKRRAGRLIAEKKIAEPTANQYWRRRGYKTGAMMRYQGSDRGFILRFANKGTEERVSTTMDAHPMYRKSISERPKNRTYKSSTLGYRGRGGMTAARNFFSSSENRMQSQLPNLETMIGQLITEEFNR